MMLRAILFLALMSGLQATVAPAASAQSFSPGEARDAVRNGEIMSLRAIFRDLRELYGGYQLDAELYSTRSGGYEYRIEWMSEDGRRINLRIDAQTGQILTASGD